MFRLYDVDDTGFIPIQELYNVLNYELFVRSHFSDVENCRQAGLAAQKQMIRSSYGDRVLKDVMLEVMEEYDNDGNKKIDFEEFQQIVTDSDVNMLLSIY